MWQVLLSSRTSQTEYLANFGLYGSLITLAQCSVIERGALVALWKAGMKEGWLLGALELAFVSRCAPRPKYTSPRS